ncbi:hypothetical protein [Nocardia sp. NPDC050793]|uniref:hypothetical protein n=1 Tax=Nocardia sp. NPDC050793 TaxID=3155159 RepID=UPI0033D45DF5
MVTDNDRDKVLEHLDVAVEQWQFADAELVEVMAYALQRGVTRNEVARRVPMFSRPTVLSVLSLIDRKDKVNQILADAGVAVLTSDDTEQVWVHTVSKPRRGLTIRHDSNNLDDYGEPGTPGRAAAAERVAAEVVPALYDAGFEMVSGRTRLTRTDSAIAFADPDAVLWIKEASKP